jgi:ABC-type nitrate/sulfonate/bicarbonate transport system substrate-binding protein
VGERREKAEPNRLPPDQVKAVAAAFALALWALQHPAKVRELFRRIGSELNAQLEVLSRD